MSSKKGFSYIRILFLTIGQKSDKICESCNNFIFGNKCVNVCPSESYAYFGYINGGKSCLTCSKKMKEEINNEKTGCRC